MAKDKLTDYDSTASGNLDVGGISVAEGMLPSGVNNAIREQMSHLADFAAGTSGVDVLKLQDDTDTNSIKLQAPASVTATTTFTLPDGDGASGQAMITDGAGTLSWAAPYGNRNLIINGAMQVVQRGTSATGITGGGFHTVDRLNNLLSSAGTWTFSQDTDVPSGQGFSYSNKRQCTTANASLGSGSYFVDYYSIEGQDLQQLAFGTSSAKSLTLSFWVKTNKTGTYQITFTTASASKSIGSSYTVNAANTWEKKTLTIVGDTASGIVNDNTVGLTIEMWYAAGTDFTSGTMPTAWGARVTADRAAALTVNLADSTSNYLNITGLQLEVGETATPFEHRSYGDELARCQRYFQSAQDSLWGWTFQGYTDRLNSVVPSIVSMRALPTFSCSGLIKIDLPGVAVATQSSFSIVTVTTTLGQNAHIVEFLNFSGLTTSVNYRIRSDSGVLFMDAEL